jgi:hypothetical protein
MVTPFFPVRAQKFEEKDEKQSSTRGGTNHLCRCRPGSTPAAGIGCGQLDNSSNRLGLSRL